MKPIKVLETDNSIWWVTDGHEVRWDLRRDIWMCNCIGYGAFVKTCKHIQACREVIEI